MTPSQPGTRRGEPHSDGTDPTAAGGTDEPLSRVMSLVRFLRANCPWDAAQTPRSLLPYLLEEAHEVADAVAAADDGELAAELGDLLLHLAFQLVLAEERGAFTARDVAERVESKMRRRHPHLYGDGEAQPWERLKAAERGERGTLDGLARGLDPLSRAYRIQERVSGVGFDWADAQGAFEKVVEEVDEVRRALEAATATGGTPQTADTGAPPDTAPAAELEAELGDLLFAVVNLSRLAGTHPMHALQRANQKFTARFEALEALARQRGIRLGEASLTELDALWDEVKAAERARADGREG